MSKRAIATALPKSLSTHLLCVRRIFLELHSKGNYLIVGHDPIQHKMLNNMYDGKSVKRDKMNLGLMWISGRWSSDCFTPSLFFATSLFICRSTVLLNTSVALHPRLCLHDIFTSAAELIIGFLYIQVVYPTITALFLKHIRNSTYNRHTVNHH